MNNNPLSPQLRADKNGKMVTRHVKTGAGNAPRTSGVPAPSIAAQRFKVPERDVKRNRKAGTTRQSIAEAEKIKSFFGIPESRDSVDPVRMSDNEILDYMQEGFTANAAIEFKRWDIAPDVAVLSTLPRFRVKETVKRMRALDLSPEEATKIIRNGMNDKLLDIQLNDNELFGLLHEERLESPTYPDRAKGVKNLVTGVCTRDDYHELGLELMGKYGGYLRVERNAGRSVDYGVFRRIIERVEGPNKVMPSQRYHEGWYTNDYKFDFHSLQSIVRKLGPESLELEYLGVLRMGQRFEDDLNGYKFLDRLFCIAEDKPLPINKEQRDEMGAWGTTSRSVADFIDGLRKAGLTPEQSYHALTNGLTLEKAKEVHLNQQATAMIDGWL